MPWLIFAVLAGAGFLLWPQVSSAIEDATTDWNAVPIDQLQAAFSGKKVADVPKAALARLYQHAVDRVNAGPQAPGIYGEKLLTPVPGQNAGDGQPIYFFRWSSSERLRDMAVLIEQARWYNPSSTLYYVAIKGQPHYGFFDKFGGELKKAGTSALNVATGGISGSLGIKL